MFHVCTVVPPGAHCVPVDGEVGPDGPPMEHQGPRPAGHRAILSLLVRPCNQGNFRISASKLYQGVLLERANALQTFSPQCCGASVYKFGDIEFDTKLVRNLNPPETDRSFVKGFRMRILAGW